MTAVESNASYLIIKSFFHLTNPSDKLKKLFSEYIVFNSMYYDQEQKMKKTKSIWLYVTVILLYFLLIGIVITVLLLAPKYTSFTSEITSHQDLPLPHPVPAVPYPSEENPIDGNVPYNYPKPFKPSQKDPLYPGINPRVLYRNESSTNLTPSNRMLQNSKYKQV